MAPSPPPLDLERNALPSPDTPNHPSHSRSSTPSSDQVTALKSPTFSSSHNHEPSEKDVHSASQQQQQLANLSTTYSTTSRAESLPPPPDGGLHAWIQVLMGWGVIFLTWGYINSFGAFQAHYESVLPQSPSAISWIGSVQICLTFVVGAFSGRMLDAGYFVPTFVVGAVTHLLGVFMMSLSGKHYWQLMLTQGVLTGLGNGILFTPSVALVSTYFSKRRGLAVGLCTTANSLGGIIYPIVVRELLPQVGFAWTTRALGLINMVLLVVAGLFMRPRLPPRKAGAIVDLTAFRDRVWVLYVCAIFCNMWALYYAFYYVAPFAVQELGMSFSDSSLIVTIINGVGLPFRVLVPFLGDHIGVLNVLVPSFLGLTIASYGWLAVHDKDGFYVYVVMYGIFAGAMQCLVPTGMASITKRMDMIGTRIGMMFSIASIAGLTGPPIGGALQEVGVGHFKPGQAWAATVMLLGFSLSLAARISKTGWVAMAKA